MRIVIEVKDKTKKAIDRQVACIRRETGKTVTLKDHVLTALDVMEVEYEV